MNEMDPQKSTKNKMLLCDWTDKKKYLFLYRMLKFIVKYGMIVDKDPEIVSFKQSIRLNN